MPFSAGMYGVAGPVYTAVHMCEQETCPGDQLMPGCAHFCVCSLQYDLQQKSMTAWF